MQDILVRCSRMGTWDRAVQVAADIAARFGGTLTAVHGVSAGMTPVMPYDPGLMAAAAALDVSRQIKEAERCAPQFVTWASSMGVRHPVWLPTAGDAASALQYVAGWHDLLVATLDADDEDPWARPAGVGKMTLATGLPTLALPADCPHGAAFPTVLVAWDGSPSAIRALQAARDFITRASRVVLWRAETAGGAPHASAKYLEYWLTRYRHDAELHTVEDLGERGARTGAALLAAARQEHADLLVMGAYGHSRLSEWIVGGVTRHVLEHSDRPMLLRH